MDLSDLYREQGRFDEAELMILTIDDGEHSWMIDSQNATLRESAA
jgi:hypothetical protein